MRDLRLKDSGHDCKGRPAPLPRNTLGRLLGIGLTMVDLLIVVNLVSQLHDCADGCFVALEGREHT